jgi:hypothetical protein
MKILEEYKKILEKIFPGVNPIELYGLSRENLLERIRKGNPVYSSSAESDVAEEEVPRICSSISSSRFQSPPEEMHEIAYTEPIPGGYVTSAADVLSLLSQCHSSVGPSTVLDLQTTSAFGNAMGSSLTIWDNQTSHQMMNTYDPHSPAPTDDLLGTPLQQYTPQTPLAADMDLYPKRDVSMFYQPPGWGYN